MPAGDAKRVGGLSLSIREARRRTRARNASDDVLPGVDLKAITATGLMRLWIYGVSHVYAQLENQPRVQVENPRWLSGEFVGSLRGDLGVDDAGAPQRLGFSLISRDGGLDGPITAWTTRRNRIGNALSSFVSLRQMRTSESPIGASPK